MNGELAQVEAEGTFDKAEIARATGYEKQQPLATDAQVSQELSVLERPRVGWSKFFAIALRSPSLASLR